MYIPKYPIVDAHELEDEMHIETDQLFEALRSYYGEQDFASQTYLYDCVRSKYETIWNSTPALVQAAYQYLAEHCGVDFGKGFLWYID